MNEDLGPNVFCAWCNKELASLSSGLSFSLCTACVPLVKAEFDARREASRNAPRAKGHRRAAEQGPLG